MKEKQHYEEGKRTEAMTGYQGYYKGEWHNSGAGVGDGYTGYEFKSSGAGSEDGSGTCKDWGRGFGYGANTGSTYSNGVGSG